MREPSMWWVSIEGPNEDDNHDFGLGTDDAPVSEDEARDIARRNAPDGGGWTLYRLVAQEERDPHWFPGRLAAGPTTTTSGLPIGTLRVTLHFHHLEGRHHDSPIRYFRFFASERVSLQAG
jgi:hypothetical protein